ncbi:unnamed protein product [Prorocentrum cordatum]|uniref:Uncharacterized protein n=1 Tax=Prorocentrum cordatum TaxID=2364126 RepID=A0ABN9T9X4_9DINO|nr:unnamed protein product [Polarella glacialis]
MQDLRPDGARNLLHQKAEMAHRLRRNLSDPALRSAVKTRGGALPPPPADLFARVDTGIRRPRVSRGASPPPAGREGRLTVPAATQAAAPASRPRPLQPRAAAAGRGNAPRMRPQSACSAASSRSAGSLARAHREAAPWPCAAGPPADALGGGCAEDAPPALHQLQGALDRLAELERERRRVFDTMVLDPGRSALTRFAESVGGSGMHTPVSAASVGIGGQGSASRQRSAPPRLSRAPAPEQGAELALATTLESEAMEKPQWLLADGRLLTASLEGENEALKRAVLRARSEIDDLVRRRCEADARARSLVFENSAAAQALQRAAAGAVRRPGPAAWPAGGSSTPVASAGCQQPGERSSAAAAASLRRLVLSTPSEASSSGGADAVREQARSRLLETSLTIERRMDELFARRGKLQAMVEKEAVEQTDSVSTDSAP